MIEIQINKLKQFIEQVHERILNNLQLIESNLMQILQFYFKANDKNILNQLQIVKKKHSELKDNLNTYRVPICLTPIKKNVSVIADHYSVIILYLDLVFIETEINLDDFQEAALHFNEVLRVQELIDNFLGSFNRITKLLKKLTVDNILFNKSGGINAVWLEIKNLYSNKGILEKMTKFGKRAGLINIKEDTVAILLDDFIYDAFHSEDSHEKRSSLKAETRDKLVEIINKIAESKEIEQLGGFISLTKLYNMIKKDYPKIQFILDDLARGIKYMKKHGFISEIETSKNSKIIQFLPIELTEDPIILLRNVGEEGVETKESLLKKLGWSESRLDNVIEFLIKKGICKFECNSLSGNKLYFPGIE